MEAPAKQSENVPLKESVERFKTKYMKNAKTPAVAGLWLRVSIVLAVGIFYIYEMLGGDSGSYSYPASPITVLIYVALMTMVLWPVGIFLTTVKEMNPDRGNGKEG